LHDRNVGEGEVERKGHIRRFYLPFEFADGVIPIQDHTIDLVSTKEVSFLHKLKNFKEMDDIDEGMSKIK